MIAATTNVATHVITSNCLADSIGSARSINVQAVSIVARNNIEKYKDAIGPGEKMAAKVPTIPYTRRKRDAAIRGSRSFPCRSKRSPAIGSTAKGSVARIKLRKSNKLFGIPMFQKPVFRLHQRHAHNTKADVGACQILEDRVGAERGIAILFRSYREKTVGAVVGEIARRLSSSSTLPSARPSMCASKCESAQQADIPNRMARPK